MKNTKKKLGILIALIVVILLGAGTYAAFYTSADVKEDVSTSNLGIKLVQTQDKDITGVTAIADDGTNGTGFQYAGAPGDTVNETMAVASTGKRDTYVRVIIHRFWSNASGTKDPNNDPTKISITCKSSNWIVTEDPNDPEVITCYYKPVLKAGETSANVMDAFSIASDLTNQYSGFSTNITFKADGIQITAAKDAMKAEWGVNATFDDSGNITAVTAQ
jgi:hypothetical protein